MYKFHYLAQTKKLVQDPDQHIDISQDQEKELWEDIGLFQAQAQAQDLDLGEDKAQDLDTILMFILLINIIQYSI